MHVPIKIRFSNKCKRCGLRFPSKEPVCPHCDGLTDDQVRKFRLRHKNQLAGNANLGRLFLYIAGLFVVAMVIYFLSG